MVWRFFVVFCAPAEYLGGCQTTQNIHAGGRLFMSSTTSGVHVICFAASITPVSAERLRNLCLEALCAGAAELRIHFSCDGGPSFHGFSLYHFLRSLPVPLTTHNTGSVESVGLIPFLAGNRRLACAHSRFLVHPMHWDFGAGRVDVTRLAEISARLNEDVERYAQIFDEITQGAQEPLEIRPHLTGSHIILTASAAIASGIIHEIAEATLPAGARVWWVQAHV
jgi:ATP-dependent protease ClpP protease subunit